VRFRRHPAAMNIGVGAKGYQILVVPCDACGHCGHVDPKRATPGKRFRCRKCGSRRCQFAGSGTRECRTNGWQRPFRDLIPAVQLLPCPLSEFRARSAERGSKFPIAGSKDLSRPKAAAHGRPLPGNAITSPAIRARMHVAISRTLRNAAALWTSGVLTMARSGTPVASGWKFAAADAAEMRERKRCEGQQRRSTWRSH
jgi:hypothetical protein